MPIAKHKKHLTGVISPQPISSPHGCQGFTLIEVISTLMLIGILAAIAISRAHSTVDVDVATATAMLKTHLRYAQTKAMNSDESWGISFTVAPYGLQNASGVAEPLPTDPNEAGNFPAEITLTPSVNPVMFDNRWGYPADNTGTVLAADCTITVSKGDASQTVTVTKNTGFVP